MPLAKLRGLALALLAVIATAIPAGAGNRVTPWEEPQRSRQPSGPGRVPREFRPPLPTAPPPGHVPDVRPPPYGSPGGGFVPLPLPYQRPQVN